MTISSSISLPSKGNYKNDSTAYIKWLAMVCGEVDAAFTNYGLLSAGSNTQMTLDTNTKTIALNANSAFVKGNYVKIYDPQYPDGRWMSGFVTDYVSGTKTLTVDVDCVSGTGSSNAWVIHPIAYVLTRSKTPSEVFLSGGNGHGTTNIKIRRFTTSVRSTGASITYVDNAANGATFTINDNGFYLVNYTDNYSVAATNIGVTVNDTQLATNIQSLAITAELICRTQISTTNKVATVKAMCPFFAGDVIRAHTDGNPNGTTMDTCNLSIRRVL